MINATLINLYHICKREMWLHANGIRMEHSSEIVADGKLLHESSYPQRADKYTEIEINGSKIDYYDAKNKIIHEIKRSNKVEAAHEWQVKYYIWLLEESGIPGVKGLLEYPKFRETKEVELQEADRSYFVILVKDIEALVSSENCPPLLNSKICKSCSYYDFCYCTE